MSKTRSTTRIWWPRVQYALEHEGEVVAAGRTIVTLTDLSDMYITVFLPSRDAGRLAIGAEAAEDPARRRAGAHVGVCPPRNDGDRARPVAANLCLSGAGHIAGRQPTMQLNVDAAAMVQAANGSVVLQEIIAAEITKFVAGDDNLVAGARLGPDGDPAGAIIHKITTIAKLEPTFVFIMPVLVAFNLPTFRLDLWGTESLSLGSITTQVQSTMVVTLWVFIGIKGASVGSARAAKRSDIGKATILGFVTVLLLSLLLSPGVALQPDLAGLPAAASMANVLDSVVGPWGSVVVRIGVAISVAVAFLSWTLLVAEIPFRAAKEGCCPRSLPSRMTTDRPQPRCGSPISVARSF